MDNNATTNAEGQEEQSRTKRVFSLLSNVNSRARAIRNQTKKVNEKLFRTPAPPLDKAKDEIRIEPSGVLPKFILYLEEIAKIQEESLGELEDSLKELE